MSTTGKTQNFQVESLQAVLLDRWVLNKWHFAVCAWFCVFFMYLNYIPLYHSDLWCHLNYGNWMIDHGKLVEEDPFLPLAKGMPVVNNAWLAQLSFAGAERLGGPQFLSNLFALVVLASHLIYARCFYLVSGRKSLAVGGVIMILLFGWTRHAIIRPEIFGGLGMAVLFWMLVRVEPWRSRTHAFGKSAEGFPRWMWFAAPAMFCLWANLHGSYAVGLVVLACHACGAVVETLWRERNLARTINDGEVRRWVWLTELAVAGTLLNPYGVDLLIATARFGGNDNLRDVLEWFPLRLKDFEGIQFVVAMLLTMVVWRHSRVRVRAAEICILLFLVVMIAPTVRMIGWLAPMLTFALLPHMRELLERIEPSFKSMIPEPAANSNSDDEQPEGAWKKPRFTYTLFSGLAIWCAFALSPISQPVLSDTPRDPQQIYSRGTPLGVTKFLRENPPEGMVWAPQWWGDWLVWDGPDQLQVFMTTTLHLAPHHVWRDYMRVAHARPGWDTALDRYAIDTIILHKELEAPLVRLVRRSASWREIYEDDLGVIFRRVDRPATEPTTEVEDSESETGAIDDRLNEEVDR
ncbi:MAG: hypothetical protein QGG36_23750 [Pirellulaceae bacterium]|nr:hypothetical protein [Pirellulaceae bacterium]